jgi:hypothetical protein
MTTQQKTAAIQAVAANHQDNLAAVKADLALIFASAAQGASGG